MSSPSTPPELLYQVRVSLRGFDPPIWRRVLVPSDVSLHKLHAVLQAAMGWEDYHLYRFEVGDTEYGESAGGELGFRSAGRAKLGGIAEAGDSFLYEYDFGDGWLHDLVIEAEVGPEPEQRYPACVDGARACPPEDCGGVPGYEELLQVLADPDHGDYEDMFAWVGDGFDPEKFDLAAANKRLGRIR